MTRDEAIKLLDCSLSELAGKLKISTAAVAKWNKDQIPELREYQIRALVQKIEESKLHEETLNKALILKNIQK
ncbi:Cro/CI family transcriptional regulator [Acinetobacter brisouii]